VHDLGITKSKEDILIRALERIKRYPLLMLDVSLIPSSIPSGLAAPRRMGPFLLPLKKREKTFRQDF
jgi:hypothetical protein